MTVAEPITRPIRHLEGSACVDFHRPPCGESCFASREEYEAACDKLEKEEEAYRSRLNGSAR